MPNALLGPQPAAIAVSSPTRSRANVPCLVAALLTAGLMWLSHFPVGCGWLAWVALAPWLLLVRADLSNRQRYFIAWLGGMAFFVPAISWMRVAHDAMVFSWIFLSLYCTAFCLAAFWLIRRLDRRTHLPLSFTVPVVWTAVEFARATLMGGFAFYLLGHTQHAALPMIQVADLAGMAAITFLVAAVNGLLAEIVGRISTMQRWFGLPPANRRPALSPQIMTVAVMLGLTLGYGSWRLSQGEFVPGPRIALIQTNIPQVIRNAADEAAIFKLLAEQTGSLTVQAAEATNLPDLVVWPETTFPYRWKELADGAPASPVLGKWAVNRAENQQAARRVAATIGTCVLLGLNADVYGADGRIRQYNSALLVPPRPGPVFRYDKMHLVPFGEFLPFKDWLPFMKAFSPYDNDYSLAAGEVQTRFPLIANGKEYHFGVVICYEDTDPALARGLVRSGAEPPVDFLVNISNDGWFMGTSEHAEHLAVSRFRAVETRRALLRAVNGGISAVIDGNGRLVALPGPSISASHSVTGLITAAVPLDTRVSLYARLGDWLPWSCWCLLLVGCCLRPIAIANS